MTAPKRVIPGWNVTLTNGSYTVSQTTNATGKYQFCGLMPGSLHRPRDGQTWLDPPRPHQS